MDLRTLIQSPTPAPIRLERGDPARGIDSIVDDSRRVSPGIMFVARAGHDADGKRFVDDAVRRGAVAVLADSDIETGDAALLLTDEPGPVGLELARHLHGDPASKITLIGVTGTNGKTTTAHMVRHLLNAADVRCGLIGTIEIDDGSDAPQTAELTTPGAIELTALLARMVANGCTACVMEVSSHALDQGRVDPSMFSAAVFTNLTGDHLDYHGSMEAYALAKARLFVGLNADASAIINADDPNAELFIDAADEAGARVVTYGLSGEPNLFARVIQSRAGGMRLRMHGPRDTWEATLPMIGQHNASNLLAAIGAAWHGAKVNAGERPLAVALCPPVPGRLERIGDGSTGFEVFVDYAHTDDALDNVLTAVRPVTSGRLRVLFGCGGDRDATKRPRMARVACELADDVVITSDNPRTENPESIIGDIVAGVPDTMPAVVVEPDRAKAIERIIASAQLGDVVVIAGKGHEDYQIIGTTKYHFDDREIAAAALSATSNTPS